MKFFTYYLSSVKLAPLVPAVLDGWYLSDPVYGISFVPPTTTCCGMLSTLSASYNNFIDGGMFFPWGYQVLSVEYDIALGYNGLFKGDTTITFVPSALDITYYDIFKIAYDWNDGTESTITQKSIISEQIFNSTDQFLFAYDLNSPIFINASHVFYASAGPVTYTPTVTVFYGDCSFIYYNFSFTIMPNSIYEIDNVHMLNTVQLPKLTGASLTTFEIESLSQVVDVITTQLVSYTTSLTTITSYNFMESIGGDYFYTFAGYPIVTIAVEKEII